MEAISGGECCTRIAPSSAKHGLLGSLSRTITCKLQNAGRILGRIFLHPMYPRTVPLKVEGKHIVIVGCNRYSLHLATLLSRAGGHVKIIAAAADRADRAIPAAIPIRYVPDFTGFTELCAAFSSLPAADIVIGCHLVNIHPGMPWNDLADALQNNIPYFIYDAARTAHPVESFVLAGARNQVRVPSIGDALFLLPSHLKAELDAFPDDYALLCLSYKDLIAGYEGFEIVN